MASTPANERSRASTISTSQHQPPANLNKEDVADWHAIDRALSHIDSVNPSHPYVLTIPQDVEPRYHHTHSVQARQWLDRTPFREWEHEASQYLTWHFHEPDEVYVLHSTRPREEREDAGSRVGTPKVGSGGAKKTMSLGAYKKKVAGGTPGPDERKKTEVNGDKKEGAEERSLSEGESVKKPAVKGPVERVKADEEVLAAVEDSDDGLISRPNEKESDGKKDLKRKREDEGESSGEAVKRKREDSKLSDAPERTKAEAKDKQAATKTREDVSKQQIPKEPATSKVADPAPSSESEQPAAEKAKTSSSKDASLQQPASEPAKKADLKQNKPKTPDKRKSSSPKPIKEDSEMALPPRLSPLRHDTSKDAGEDTAFLLPPRLSPTLPANITATLAARKHNRSTSKSSANGDNLQTPTKALENGVARRRSPVNGFRANSSSPMVRSDAEDARGRLKTNAPKVRSPSPSGEESEIAVGRTAATAKKERKSKLIVKLKFKQRSTKEFVKQLLKLPSAKQKPEQPKPSSTTLKATDARHREQRDANAKGVAQRIGPATKGVAKKVDKSSTSTPTPAEKRAREEESEADSRATKRKKVDMAVYEPPAKRKKSTPDALDVKKQQQPPTPAQSTQHPVTPASSAPKPSSQPTPSAAAPKKSGKELLAAATTSASMKREASHDSQGQVPTPSASSSSPAASSASQQQASTAPKSTLATSSTPAPSQTKTARQKEWDSQHRIYNDLGRELKRSVEADLKAASATKTKDSTDKPTAIQKIAAIKTLESFLAFFLAFTANDEASLAAEPRLRLRTTQWRSLEGYMRFVKNNTEPFPVLQGLASSLAVVFCARIMDLCVETSGNQEVLTQTWMLLSRSAAEAEGKLDGRTLQELFPQTWAEAAKGGSDGEEKEKLEPGKFAGPFKLPLGVQTKPVRAVRAAERMLREWVEKEGLEYQMRLKLE